MAKQTKDQLAEELSRARVELNSLENINRAIRKDMAMILGMTAEEPTWRYIFFCLGKAIERNDIVMLLKEHDATKKELQLMDRALKSAHEELEILRNKPERRPTVETEPGR